MNRRKILRAAGLAAALALVWSATAGILWNASQPKTGDERFARAERLVFYRVEPSSAVTLRLPAGADAVRVVTHLVLPEGSTYAPERQYLYGFRLRLLDADGRRRLEQPLFTRTRQSKADPVDGVWRKESAFGADPDLQVADEREFLVELPRELRGSPATVELEYAGDKGALLLRAYARFEHRGAMLGATEAESRRRAEARAERTTFVPWEKLGADTQDRLAGERWERLDAHGEPGKDFLTEAVHRTDFRLPLVEVAEASDERLLPGRAVALNVQGPVRLWVWLWRALPDPKGPPSGPVHLTAASEGAQPLQWNVTVPPAEPVRQAIDVPAGVHTVSLANAGDSDLRFTVEGPRYAWIAPDELKPVAAGPHVALLPDVRRMEAHVAGPSCEPIVLELGERAEDLARLFRIDARALAPSGRGAPARVEVSVLDARDQKVGAAAFEVAAPPSAFESADLPLLPSGQLPCGAAEAGVSASTVEVTGWPVAVTEPASARVFAPPTGRRLVIRATRPVAIQLFGFLSAEGGAEVARPYADHALSTLRWRHAPLERASWHPMRPANHRALEIAGAEVSLRTQVRLDAAAFTDGAEPRRGRAVTLVPAGAPPSQDVLEPETDPRDLTDGSRGLYARVAPNEPVRLRFPERTPTRPELRLELADPSALGRIAQVEIDGKVVRRFRLRATRWRELLPPAKPGDRELVLRTRAAGVSATVNRPPAETEARPALRERTVYRAEGGIRVPVRKKGRGEVTVNIVLYAPQKEGTAEPRVAITIDRGAPRRATGLLVPRLTRAVRHEPLPASDRDPAAPMRESGARWFARTIPVTLGEDLAPGLHWVEVRPLRGGQLWARFFTFGGDGDEAEAQQWIRTGWGGEDLP